jgi:uncharacterized protein (DUF1501 family)
MSGPRALARRAYLAYAAYFALGLAAGLAPAAAAAPACGPEADLRAARPFVLVVAAGGEGLKRSEAYGDWQWYLQSFIERRRGGLAVHQVTAARARKLLKNWPAGLQNATLFANPRGKGLLHRGLVLEPEVYQIGKAFAEDGPPAPEAASFGLEPFELKPR